MKKQNSFFVVCAAVLAIFAYLSATPKASGTTYYIDYVAGLDSNNGTSTETAWKHYPMDVRATGTSDTTTLVAGDILAPKGGVVYVNSQSKQVPNGAVGNPIIIDGALWGVGKAIETGDNQAFGAWSDFGSRRDNWTIQNVIIRDCGGYSDNNVIWDGITIAGVDAGTEVFTTATDHNLVVGEDVQFNVATGGALPGPLVPAENSVVRYFVKTTPTPTTFTISATSGGATLNITSAGSGTIKVWEPILFPPNGIAINIDGGGENITIRVCEFYENGQWKNTLPMFDTNSITGTAVWMKSVNNVLIEDCIIQRSGKGLQIVASPTLGKVSDVTVNRCQFSDSLGWCIDIAPVASGGVLENITISYCKIYDYLQFDFGNWKGGGEKPHANGIFLRNSDMTATWTNLRIHGNEFYIDNPGASWGGTGDIFISQGPSALIYNNIFSNTKKAQAAIVVDWFSTSPGQVVRILNNTFSGSTTWVRTREETRPTYRDIHWANNIGRMTGGASNLIMVVQEQGIPLYETLNRNLYFHPSYSPSQNLCFLINGFANANLSQVQAMSAGRPNQFEVNSLYQDPLFLDTTGPFAQTDWHIESTSPARGMGENFSAYFTHDKDGNPRPSNGAWDVGAYQFNGSPPADVTPPTILAASVDASGGTGSIQFSESVQGVDLAHYAITGRTLSALSGTGENRTFTISPVIQAGPAFTLTYTGGAGRTADAAGNLLASASVIGVNNSLETTPTPPRAQRLGPGGGGRKPFGF